MVVCIAPASPLDELEARTDYVLEQLDLLNERVERTLAEYASQRPAA